MDRNTHRQILSELYGCSATSFPNHYSRFTNQISSDAGNRLGFKVTKSIPIEMPIKTPVNA
ncbi:MAG: hypothetical protein FWC00_02585 [Firmicutes bacterium]|nr:hypothetical protein [Bacillota bacterium]